MANEQLHESPEDLSAETREMHRALVSLMEELEAVDWYAQRIDATSDAELARILSHNRDEEKEHACMTLEWIRQHDPKFDEYLRQFLFQGRDESIVEAEHAGEAVVDRSLGIGSLRARDGANGAKEAKAS